MASCLSLVTVKAGTRTPCSMLQEARVAALADTSTPSLHSPTRAVRRSGYRKEKFGPESRP